MRCDDEKRRGSGAEFGARFGDIYMDLFFYSVSVVLIV